MRSSRQLCGLRFDDRIDLGDALTVRATSAAANARTRLGQDGRRVADAPERVGDVRHRQAADFPLVQHLDRRFARLVRAFGAEGTLAHASTSLAASPSRTSSVAISMPACAAS